MLALAIWFAVMTTWFGLGSAQENVLVFARLDVSWPAVLHPWRIAAVGRGPSHHLYILRDVTVRCGFVDPDSHSPSFRLWGDNITDRAHTSARFG